MMRLIKLLKVVLSDLTYLIRIRSEVILMPCFLALCSPILIFLSIHLHDENSYVPKEYGLIIACIGVSMSTLFAILYYCFSAYPFLRVREKRAEEVLKRIELRRKYRLFYERFTNVE